MAAKHGSHPMFRELSAREVETVLAGNNVGRIGFSFRNTIDIRPLHYVYSKRWLFGRTSPGDKLVTLRHNQWVVFEVDEVRGPFDWESVIVRGTFYRLSNDGSKYDVALYRRCLRQIRKLAPDALTKRDPVSFRTELFGISVDSSTGRSSSSEEPGNKVAGS